MKNISIHLIGGALDGQTYTAREDEVVLHIHHSNVKDVVTDENVNKERASLSQGQFYIYRQESEGSDRYLFVKTE